MMGDAPGYDFVSTIWLAPRGDTAGQRDRDDARPDSLGPYEFLRGFIHTIFDSALIE